MNYLPEYLGTSSVLAVTLLDELLRQQAAAGVQQQQQPGRQWQGDPRLRLAGTLAHEASTGHCKGMLPLPAPAHCGSPCCLVACLQQAVARPLLHAHLPAPTQVNSACLLAACRS